MTQLPLPQAGLAVPTGSATPDWVLGLDTSFYTTSVAIVGLDGRLLADQRSLLPVPAGERGLRPQEGVFLHVKNLPGLLETALAAVRDLGVNTAPRAVAASLRPLPQPDSYLPVFRVSEGFGRATAAAWGVPFVAATHQEGHLLAGAWSGGLSLAETAFIAAHLSGGTTDILDVRPQLGGRLDIRRLGSGSDLHVGQFIDRVGVALGLPFPAGPSLEQLAAEGEPGAVVIPSHASGADLSFAGPETAALRLIERGARPADVALAVQACVARGVAKALSWALRETGRSTVLLVGGVAANGFLRQELQSRLRARVIFAEPWFSTDNAVGVALLGRAAVLGSQP